MHLQEGRTVLFYASMKGHMQVLQQLLQVHANLKIRDKVERCNV